MKTKKDLKESKSDCILFRSGGGGGGIQKQRKREWQTDQSMNSKEENAHHKSY